VRRVLGILALGCLLGLVSAAPPVAAAGLTPDADCQRNGRLTQSYTAGELKAGLTNMPAYQREYSGCYNVLQQALLLKIGALKAGGSSGGSSFLPTWLIVVLAILVVGGVAFGIVALRNRGSGRGPD
jgi:hypothetical protein